MSRAKNLRSEFKNLVECRKPFEREYSGEQLDEIVTFFSTAMKFNQNQKLRAQFKRMMSEVCETCLDNIQHANNPDALRKNVSSATKAIEALAAASPSQTIKEALQTQISERRELVTTWKRMSTDYPIMDRNRQVMDAAIGNLQKLSMKLG